MSQILILEKNFLESSTTFTPADNEATNIGTDFVDYLIDRKNTSGWATTGSSDSATCTLTAEMDASKDVTKVLLVEHNFKDFDLHYWNGTAWVLIESLTGNTETTTYHTIEKVAVYKVRITITATQAADEDKRLAQFIVTDGLSSGQFEAYPEIKSMKHKTAKKITTMLSGKALVIEGVGATEFTLSVKILKLDEDLTLIEKMYSNKEGFLVLLSGGNETQFSSKRVGYRKQDIYLMRAINDYSDDFYKGVYSAGVKISIKLREAIQ